MELNVNTVYTTVLSILNKEQRGYMTPDEFNKVATQVQLQIFESFFEDLNQYLRMPKTDEEFASRINHIEEEIQNFEEYKSASSHANGVYGFPQDSNNKNEVYRLGSVYFNAVAGTPQIELVNRKEYKQQLMSPLTQPSKKFPIAILKGDAVEVFPKVTTFNPVRSTAADDVKFSYIRKPNDVKWGYNLGSLGQYLYDDRTYSDTMLLKGQSIVFSTIPGATTATGGTYTNIPTSTSGSGTGATVDINVIGTGSVTLTSSNLAVTVSNSDQSNGYAVGDTLSIAAGAFGSLNNTLTSDALTSSQIAGTSPTTQGSVQFDIDSSQQTKVILEILKYSGIIIRDPQIVQAAQQELIQEEANEKR
tara:strand:- start:1943 stop:3028 length:1086 start_codon:yes stop_codon:yes gene_type:complete